MKRKLIFIVGLQKSGTFVLRELLIKSELVENPFNGEGHDFWGDLPTFSPKEFPTGTIYQKNKGKMGHEINEDDATDEIRECLLSRLKQLESKSAIIVNKNPFNVVRISWLRKLFPDSVIVGIVRQPVSNVFSLRKKFIPHPGQGNKPEKGWWGVKPQEWQKLIRRNKIIQCALQWQAVNSKLLQNKDLLDLIVHYHDICQSPLETVQKILSIIERQEVKLSVEYPVIKCFDNEYQNGSRLLSKKRKADGSASLDTSWLEQEKLEIGALSVRDIVIIEEICLPLYQQILDS